MLPSSLNGIPVTLLAPFGADFSLDDGLIQRRTQGERAVPVVDTPHRYIGRMVLGVVIGLAAGLAVGFAWHLARTARTAGAARLVEGRLADALARSAALAAELKAVTETAAVAETASPSPCRSHPAAARA